MEALYDDPLRIAKKSDAARIVIDRYESAKRKNEARRPLLDDWYAQYRSYMKADKDSPFRSQLFVPTTFTHIESHLPRLAASRPRIEIWGRGSEDAQRARAQRALAYFYWDSLRMDMALVDYAKSALIYGTAWWKVGWRRKTRTRRRKVLRQVPMMSLFNIPLGMREEFAWEDVVIREQDGPTVDLMEPDDLYFDPDGFSEDTAGWIIEADKMTLNELEEAIDIDGEPLYDESVLAEMRRRSESGNPVETSGETNTGLQRKDLFSTGTASHTTDTPDPFKRQFTVLTEWTDDTVRAVIKEWPDLDPIRNARNEYGMKPFVRYTPIPLPNEMNGASMCEQLASIQYSQNLLTNARFDHVMQTVHAMHTVRRASGLTPSQIRFRPGGMIPVIDHNDIQPMAQPRLDFTHYRESDYQDQLAQKVSGSTDIYQGIGAASGGTATESSILAQSAASRVGLMFQILSAQSLHRLGRLWVRMNELYLDRERTLRVLGDDFMETDPQTGQPVQGGGTITVSPEQLATGSNEELDLVIDVSQTEPGTRQFKLQRAQMLIQTLGPMVAPGGPIFNRMVKGALEGLGEDNPDKVIGEEQSFIQQMQQQAAAAQAAQAQSGGTADQLAIQASADAPRGDQF